MSIEDKTKDKGNEVINLLHYKQKKQLDGMFDGITQQFKHSQEIAQEFYQLLINNKAHAINKITEYLDKSVNDAKDHPDGIFVRGEGGGPHECYTFPILRAVGMFYASLNKPDRKKALSQCLKFLNQQNYCLSQNNVQYIHEPWLVGDILNNRSIYYCGYEKYAKILEHKKKWKEFAPDIGKANSLFWIARAISDPKSASLEIRTAFMNEMPLLVSKTQDAIAGIIYSQSLVNERKRRHTNKGIEECIVRYDSLWHDAVRSKIKEEKWILNMDEINKIYPSKEQLLEKARQKAIWNLIAWSDRRK